MSNDISPADAAMFKKLEDRRKMEASLKERDQALGLDGSKSEPSASLDDGREQTLTLGAEDMPSPELASLAESAQNLALQNRMELAMTKRLANASRMAGRRGFWMGLMIGLLLGVIGGRGCRERGPEYFVDGHGMFFVKVGGQTIGPAMGMEEAKALAFSAQSNLWMNGQPGGLKRFQ